jgi:hypothetical protein
MKESKMVIRKLSYNAIGYARIVPGSTKTFGHNEKNTTDIGKTPTERECEVLVLFSICISNNRVISAAAHGQRLSSDLKKRKLSTSLVKSFFEFARFLNCCPISYENYRLNPPFRNKFHEWNNNLLNRELNFLYS